MPCSSQAARVSSSRFEPPGWMIAVTPAAAATSGPSRNGKKASEASTEPRARSPAFATAIRTESSRLIWPAPTPTSCRPCASTIAFDLTAWQTRQAKPERRALLGVGRGAAGRDGPGGRVGFHRVPVLHEQPALDPAQVEARGAGGRRGRSGRPRSSRRTLFFQVGLVVSRPKRVGLEAGGDDRLDEPAGHAQPLGRRAVDRPVQADDPAEGADGVALVGQLEGLGQRRSATAAPQGLLCLRIAAAGSAKRRTSRRALSRSSRLLYDSSLPCRTFAVARFGPGRPRLDVEGGPLVRVLAVAEHRPALEREGLEAREGIGRVALARRTARAR